MDHLPIPRGARLSEHLSWAEAVTTQHRDPAILREQENPPPLVRANLRRLALDVFEPARELVGRLLVSSGYRCPALNGAIAGSSRTSAHMDGRALDVIPLDLDIRDAYQRLAQSGIAFDQLIFELGRWIHIGAAPHGVEPRRERLAMYVRGVYVPWTPNDPRFTGEEQLA